MVVVAKKVMIEEVVVLMDDATEELKWHPQCEM